MLENDDFIIFPQKTMIKSMVQEYNGVKLNKSPETIANAKFVSKFIPLLNDHYNNEAIGQATNFKHVGDEWRGDIYFDKSKLNETDLGKLRRLERKELSLGYKYDLKKLEDDEIFGDMENLRVEHLAWVETGRCSSDDGCGLDSSDETQHAHDTVIIMTKCDEIEAENKLLKEKLTATDSVSENNRDTIAKLTEQSKKLSEQLDGYQALDRADTMKEIIEISSYAEDSLEKLSLQDLKDKLETLKKGKAHDNYPPGKNIKKKDIKYDPSKVQDMTKLATKKEGDK